MTANFTSASKYQTDHPDQQHTQTKVLEDGSRLVEPVSTVCIKAIAPVLQSYELSTDGHVLHLLRSTKASTLYELVSDDPKVALPLGLQGQFTSVPAVNSLVKDRCQRLKRGYTVDNFSKTAKCKQCAGYHVPGECPDDLPEPVVVPSLRSLWQNALDIGVPLDAFEVVRMGAVTVLFTDSKSIQFETEGECASAWVSDPKVKVEGSIFRPSREYIHFISIFKGTADAHKLEAGYTRLIDGVLDLKLKLLGLCK
jgi:hypothetical protein